MAHRMRVTSSLTAGTWDGDGERNPPEYSRPRACSPSPNRHDRCSTGLRGPAAEGIVALAAAGGRAGVGQHRTEAIPVCHKRSRDASVITTIPGPSDARRGGNRATDGQRGARIRCVTLQRYLLVGPHMGYGFSRNSHEAMGQAWGMRWCVEKGKETEDRSHVRKGDVRGQKPGHRKGVSSGRFAGG